PRVQGDSEEHADRLPRRRARRGRHVPPHRHPAPRRGREPSQPLPRVAAEDRHGRRLPAPPPRRRGGVAGRVLAGAVARTTVVAGRYVLQRCLGKGAQGEVWEAEDRLAGATVAVKLLHADRTTEPARVRREVSALRLLRLPGVVRLLDEGTDDGRPFLVME